MGEEGSVTAFVWPPRELSGKDSWKLPERGNQWSKALGKMGGLQLPHRSQPLKGQDSISFQKRETGD